ncbi:hypothetical protein B566_EDAN017223 [Ephemera danica]|nr:hypothetical protein B566_EDAN017223 [Ephemera danica]
MSEEATAVASTTPVDPTTPKLEESESVELTQNGGGPPSRVRLTDKQLETVTKEELLVHWRDQDTYVDSLESQSASLEGELAGLREAMERIRQQHAESQHREKVLVRRLASKEQEMQDYASQLAELRAAQVPSAAALRSALLDPAASLLVQKLRQELAATKTRLEETQNELSAWKFTPDSNTGKRLMAKCRLLYQENEELGRVIASGRLAKLEGELALQKSFSDEVKKSQSELDEFLQELDEDVEGMQGTIYFLQQQLKAAKETVVSLTQEINDLRQTSGTPQQLKKKKNKNKNNCSMFLFLNLMFYFIFIFHASFYVTLHIAMVMQKPNNYHINYSMDEEGEDNKEDESRGGEEDAGCSWAGGEEEEEEVTPDSAGVEEQLAEKPAEPMETETPGMHISKNHTTAEKAVT